MGFFDRLHNDTTYNPLFLEDATGLEASMDEAVLDEDNQALERAIVIKKLVGLYGEDVVKEMIERGEI